MADLDMLERRVTVLEHEVEGEKLVSRHILEQTRRNSDDLAAIRARLAAHDQRFDTFETRFDRQDVRLGGHDARFDRLEAEIRSLRADLSKIVAETLREVLRERDR